MAQDATGTPSSLGIPTINTAVDPPSGKGENSIVASIDTLLQQRVTAAGTNVWQNKLLTNDSQPAFDIKGDGKLEWGVGGSTVPDVNLYRFAANGLATDDVLRIYGNTGANNFWSFDANVITWYQGGVNDTNLYRSAAARLATDGEFNVGRDVVITGNGYAFYARNADVANRIIFHAAVNNETNDRFAIQAQGVVVWGPGGATAPDTNLYRSNVGTLKTDTNLFAGTFIQAHTGAAGQVFMGAAGPASEAGIVFGSGVDTNLYRSAADRLKTDDLFDATGLGLATKTKAGIPVDGDWAVAPPVGTAVLDTTNNKIWYRTAAATWKGVVIA